MIQDIGQIEDLQERLTNDGSGSFKRDYIDGLMAFKAQINSAINRGLPGDQFQVASDVVKAFEQAEKVIEGFWISNHDR